MKNTVRNRFEPLYAPGQRIGHRKGQDVYHNKRYDGKERRVPEGVHEGAVRQRLDIVAETDELEASEVVLKVQNDR